MRYAWRSLPPVFLLATACRGGSATVVEPTVGPVPPALRATPASAVLGSQRVGAEPYLWRDFQPGPPAASRPLTAVVRIRAVDGAVLAADVTADSLWVILGDRAWVAATVQESPRAETGAYLEVVARGGPEWETGARVDVVVRLRDGAGGVAYVRAAGQPIVRTS